MAGLFSANKADSVSSYFFSSGSGSCVVRTANTSSAPNCRVTTSSRPVMALFDEVFLSGMRLRVNRSAHVFPSSGGLMARFPGDHLHRCCDLAFIN